MSKQRYIQQGYMRSALGSRQVALTSLRPGDWLLHTGGLHPHRCVVIQSSGKHKRIEVRWDSPSNYSHLMVFALADIHQDHWRYLGRGERRRWWPHLPRFLRRRLSRYAGPRTKGAR